MSANEVDAAMPIARIDTHNLIRSWGTSFQLINLTGLGSVLSNMDAVPLARPILPGRNRTDSSLNLKRQMTVGIVKGLAKCQKI
jgi:hypothetical protein